MHSEGTMIHLQHMIDRACRGNNGEEREIASILFDEVYTFVKPVYDEEEICIRFTKAIIKKYISKLEGRSIIDVRSDIHMYAASSMYRTLKENSETSVLEENLKDYEAFSVLSSDEQLYDMLTSYNCVFESKKAYNNAPQRFKEMPKGLIILMELYVYEGCSVSHIAEILDEDKKLIENNIGLLENIIGEIGMYEYDEKDVDEHHKKKHHTAKKGKKHKEKINNNKVENEYDTDDEEDEPGIIDIILPNLNQKTRTLIDIIAAAVIFIIGMIILRF